MDIFSQTVRAFSAFPFMESWEEAQNIFQQAASRKPNHWLLPTQACTAVGGKPAQSTFAVLAVACAHVSILLVDDMLDADPRGDHHRLGMPAASNLACAFQSAALYSAARCIREHDTRSIALVSFNEMFFSTAFGQFLDTRSSADESTYWRVAKTKSSPFFGAAFHLGALAGGGTLETADQLMQLGYLYGEMIQIHDDMHDAMETPANPDWLQKRAPLPILFASLVDHPERERFLALKESILDPIVLEEAQEILIRCGAISYCADQIVQKHQAAKRLLSDIPLEDHVPISSLLDEIIAPVDKLLEACSL